MQKSGALLACLGAIAQLVSGAATTSPQPTFTTTNTVTTVSNIADAAFVSDYLQYQGMADAPTQDGLKFKIVNGVRVPTNVPWFASFNIVSDVRPDGTARVGLCGGALISPKHVVTAAHCFYDAENSEYTRPGVLTLANGASIPNILIQLGGLVRMLNKPASAQPAHASPYTFSAGTAVTCHPNYDSEKQINDICIITLAEAVPNAPVSINNVTAGRTAVQVDANQAPGVITTALGFGDTSYQGQTSDYLLKVDMPLVDKAKCIALWNKGFTGNPASGPGASLITDTVLCADSTNGDTCQGDSGGPLVNAKAGVLVGVTSMGVNCKSGIPGVYTRISAYADWIRAVTAGFA